MARRSIQDIFQEDAGRLTETLGLGTTTARIEIQCLLQYVLGVPRAYLLAHPEQRLSTVQQAAYDSLLHRRQQSEPLAYILGEREFFSLTFKVTPDTLIPRPETELLVELALRQIPQPFPSPKGRGGIFRVLDLGTGSGAIALSIAHTRPDIEVLAVDASIPALAVARENAQRLGITNASFLQSDWFHALGDQSFNLIVSNPPYVAAGDEHLTRGDVRFEPLPALASGADGLDDIRQIIGQAGNFLENQGWLLLEHGYDQGAAVRDLLHQNGFAEVFSEKDIAGIERVSGGIITC